MKIRRKDNHSMTWAGVEKATLRTETTELHGWTNQVYEFLTAQLYEEVPEEPVWRESFVMVEHGVLKIQKEGCWCNVCFRDGYRFRLDEGWVKVEDLLSWLRGDESFRQDAYKNLKTKCEVAQRPMLLVEERGDDSWTT